MSRSITLELYLEGPRGRLYAVRHRGEPDNVLNALFHTEENRVCTPEEATICRQYYPCTEDCRRKEHLLFLAKRFESAVEDYGFNRKFFRPNENYPGGVRAFWAEPYRVYGVLLPEQIFIATGGGFKVTRRIQESPELIPSFLLAKDLDQWLEIKLRRDYQWKLPQDEHRIARIPEDLIHITLR
jgi:hypothetical protein